MKLTFELRMSPLAPMLKQTCVLLVGFALAACAGMGNKQSTPAAPGTLGFMPPPKELSSFRVSDPEPPPVVDKELETVPPEMQPKVEQWIAYFQGKGRPHMERYLSRSTRYIQLMKRIMRQNGLPEDLVYIVMIESGFSSRATSRAAAVGYWQFIKGTGRRYGLEINSFVDERRDPVLSTQAAAEYFKGLYSVFGSWYLAMASYNVGENRVKKEVMNYFTRDFWELARKRRFPKETVNYIPKFIAARLIAKDPEKYGFTDIEFDPPLEFELVKVDKAVNLRNMALKMGMDYADLKVMNPKFRGEIAPLKPDNALELRVPVGQVQTAIAAAGASTVDKVEFIADAGETETYKVRSGDSLYTIAHHYHTTVAWLRDVNDIKSGKKLRIGMRLQVPDRSGSHSHRAVAAAAKVKTPKVDKNVEDTETAASNPEVVTKKGVYYIVQPGDTLSAIADDYDSTIAELRRMNKLKKNSVIKVGMKLKVPKDEGLPAALDDSSSTAVNDPNRTPANTNAVGGESITHKVQAGESLSTIAKKYGVTVRQIREANNLKKRAKINSGMTIQIPVKSKPSSTSADTRPPSKSDQQDKVKVHVVRRGEDLTHIAKKYQVSLSSLREKNRIDNKSKIFVGARLLIPVAEAAR